MVTEQETGWLVYHWEWVVVYSVTTTPLPEEVFPAPHVRMAQELMAHRDEVYGGRVDPTHVRFTFAPGNPAEYTGHLELLLPNQRAEFKEHTDAIDWAAANELRDAKIVLRGTKAHQELRSYGTKMLATS